MTVTLSLVLVFTVLLAALLKTKTLGFGAAFVATGFGFFLASTGAAGPITHLTTAVTDAVAAM